MSGYDIKVTGSKVVVTIDLANEPTLSQSGKSLIVASTHGAITIPGTDVKLSLNAYRKAE